MIAAIVLWAVGTETGPPRRPVHGRAIDRAKELVAAGQTGPDAKLAELGAHAAGR